MIERKKAIDQLELILQENPICALLGPRQCGKSTLAREFAEKKSAHWFDLESAESRAALENPEWALRSLRGLIVIDEIQRLPALFEALRPLADRKEIPARFLILGSVSPEIIKGVSESLAGRVGFLDLGGFALHEVQQEKIDSLWIRGGFPRSFLAASEPASVRWRKDFIRTYLEQDLPRLGLRVSSETLRRFWTMIAHYHGQTWNAADLARSLGSSEPTARHYLDILCGTYLVRRLQPWHTNLGKRELKAPKIYVRDPGLLHSLLGLKSMKELRSHPKLGASWEGFALEQLLNACGDEDSYYWGTYNHAELDLLLFRQGKAWGFEFKSEDAPRMTKSLHIALEDLNLEKAWIVYPGEKQYSIHEKVEVIPLKEMERLKRNVLGS